jgi:tRNA modification GTPase
MADLVAALGERARDLFAPGETSLITRERQRTAVRAYSEALAQSLAETSAELKAEELRRATDALGRVSGRVGVEDLLDVIFREFCIGK